jgi:hypothetical protein
LQFSGESKIMTRYLRCFTFAFVFAGSAAAASPPPAQEYTGRGTQVYRCETDAGTSAWKLLGPDAHMYNGAGQAGIFAEVTTVTRTDTQGGGAPAQACTQSNQGATSKVPYSARYTFFSEVSPAPAP